MFNIKIIASVLFVFTGISAFAQRDHGSRNRSGGPQINNADRQRVERPSRQSSPATVNANAATDRRRYNPAPRVNPTPRVNTTPAIAQQARPGSPSSSYRGGNSYNYRQRNVSVNNNRTVVQNNITVNNYRAPRPGYRWYYGGAYHPRPVYYRPYSRPTFGIHISILPIGYHPFYYNHRRYYYHGGNYYRYYNNYYETIPPFYGAVIPVLPPAAILVPIGGRNYYESGGTYYEPMVDSYGTTSYTVAGIDGVLKDDADAGTGNPNDIISDASIQSNMQKEQSLADLPSTYKTVTLDDKIYYVSPEGDYYVKLIDEEGKGTYQLTTKEKLP